MEGFNNYFPTFILFYNLKCIGILKKKKNLKGRDGKANTKIISDTVLICILEQKKNPTSSC